MLDKLAFLLYSRGKNFYKNVKAHSKKMRIVIATKDLVRVKNQVIEEKLTLQCPRLDRRNDFLGGRFVTPA